MGRFGCRNSSSHPAITNGSSSLFLAVRSRDARLRGSSSGQADVVVARRSDFHHASPSRSALPSTGAHSRVTPAPPGWVTPRIPQMASILPSSAASSTTLVSLPSKALSPASFLRGHVPVGQVPQSLSRRQSRLLVLACFHLSPPSRNYITVFTTPPHEKSPDKEIELE